MAEPLTKEYLDEKFDKAFDRFADTVQRGFSDVREQMDARFGKMDERFTAVDERFNAVDERFTGIDATLGRISAAVADLKVGREEDRERLRRLEEISERVYNRIDQFLVIMQRQEADVAALRTKVERFEERLTMIEQQLARA